MQEGPTQDDVEESDIGVNLKPSLTENLKKSTLEKSKKSVLSVVISKLTYYHVFRIPGVTFLIITHSLFFTTSLGARTYLVIYSLHILGCISLGRVRYG